MEDIVRQFLLNYGFTECSTKEIFDKYKLFNFFLDVNNIFEDAEFEDVLKEYSMYFKITEVTEDCILGDFIRHNKSSNKVDIEIRNCFVKNYNIRITMPVMPYFSLHAMTLVEDIEELQQIKKLLQTTCKYERN
jgi:hypothetical protein